MSLSHNQFVNNTAVGLISFNAEKVAIKLNEFIDNKVDAALVRIEQLTPHVTITNDLFIDNNVLYDVLIYYDCKPGLRLSLAALNALNTGTVIFLDF